MLPQRNLCKILWWLHRVVIHDMHLLIFVRIRTYTDIYIGIGRNIWVWLLKYALIIHNVRSRCLIHASFRIHDLRKQVIWFWLRISVRRVILMFVGNALLRCGYFEKTFSNIDLWLLVLFKYSVVDIFIAFFRPLSTFTLSIVIIYYLNQVIFTSLTSFEFIQKFRYIHIFDYMLRCTGRWNLMVEVKRLFHVGI